MAGLGLGGTWAGTLPRLLPGFLATASIPSPQRRYGKLNQDFVITNVLHDGHAKRQGHHGSGGTPQCYIAAVLVRQTTTEAVNAPTCCQAAQTACMAASEHATRRSCTPQSVASPCSHLPSHVCLWQDGHGMLGEFAAREGGVRIMHALKHSQLLRRKLQGAPKVMDGSGCWRHHSRQMGGAVDARGSSCAKGDTLAVWQPSSGASLTAGAPLLHLRGAEFSEAELTELLTAVFLEGHQGALQARPAACSPAGWSGLVMQRQRWCWSKGSPVLRAAAHTCAAGWGRARCLSLLCKRAQHRCTRVLAPFSSAGV